MNLALSATAQAARDWSTYQDDSKAEVLGGSDIDIYYLSYDGAIPRLH